MTQPKEPLELAAGDWQPAIPGNETSTEVSAAFQTLARPGHLLPFPQPAPVTWRAGDDQRLAKRLARSARRPGAGTGLIGMPGSYQEPGPDGKEEQGPDEASVTRVLPALPGRSLTRTRARPAATGKARPGAGAQ